MGQFSVKIPAPEGQFSMELNTDLFTSSVKVVAGARFELTTFRL